MLECRLLSSLTKVFADEEPKEEILPLSILRGETASCQVAVRAWGWVIIETELPGFTVRLREVCNVPVAYPYDLDRYDEDYLRYTPGLYPDILCPLPEKHAMRPVGWWKPLWIDVEPEENTPTGDYTLFIRITNEATGETWTGEQRIHFVNVSLPEQKLLHTEWFHSDCLADYYHVPVWSEEHWRIVENFIRSAVRMGVNVIMTPIFTLPLDTAMGLYRTTTQLVDVARQDGRYAFGFDKLERWVKMCQSCGITHFEMAHLYSQWGSNRTPQIVGTDNGVPCRLFGWDQVATDPEYREFLAQFLPALTGKLKELGVAERCLFHISDEPGPDTLELYRRQKEQVMPYLQDYVLLDALSHYEFYEQGVVQHPVCSTDSNDLPKFLDAGIEDLWLYYCSGQRKDVSNRFIAMPAARTRVLGVQLYLEKIAGFLHWGFNFYNSVLSMRHIDPYAATSGSISGSGFPAGDPFIVYPGEEGQAWESIRYMAIRQGMHDMRALELLEALAGRETVEALLQETVTLNTYPRDNSYLPMLRQRVNREIEKRI